MNALGSCFQSNIGQYSAWLAAQNYTVSPLGPTVSELRTVKDAALFFIDTHGGSGTNIVGRPTYALWTATSVDLQSDINLADNLFAGRLVYFLANHHRATPPATGCLSAWHYAITPSFVSVYMTFAPRSFVFFNGCSSASAAAASMQQAFAAAGAAMYAGWTWPVQDNVANNAAAALFDRLLGVNVALPETPPQRPVDLKSIQKELQWRGLDASAYCPAPNGTCPPNRPVAAILTFIPLATDPAQAFSLLAPTIERTETRDPACCDAPELVRLDVYGLFGREPGQVFVNNAPLRVLSWMTDTIQVELPPHGPGSAGNVVVKVRGHASNPAPLTEWRGQIKWREHYDNLVGEPGTYADVTCDLHFRSNFHAWRESSGGTEFYPDFARVEESQDSRCTWQMAGDASWVEPSTGVLVRWVLSGSGAFTWRPPNAGPGPYLGFSGVIFLDEAVPYIGLSLQGLVSGEWTVYRDGVLTYTTPQSLLGTGPVAFLLDEQFDIQAGNSTFAFPQGPVTTTWNAIPARFAPNEQTPG